ncbi:hypothetical protein yfred0001_29600 [Yersinia frederiksenii ATCC 33641]|nr:hypothetical protein yfred0001_29600 [Yersinia frederiksenii ATCC 33641]
MKPPVSSGNNQKYDIFLCLLALILITRHDYYYQKWLSSLTE